MVIFIYNHYRLLNLITQVLQYQINLHQKDGALLLKENS